jgi:hypothetical protein
VGINRDWKTIRENIRIVAKQSQDYYELRKHKQWFNEGCSELFDHREHAK